MDFFKDLEDIRHSFKRFAKLLPEDGCLIINRQIDRIEELTEGLTCRVITFGAGADADYSFADASYDALGRASYTLMKKGENCGTINLGVVGEHNILNSLSVIALMDVLGIDFHIMRDALSSFSGTDRRFELKGEVCGIKILDDYAHHPTEITATLKAAANYPHKNLWCVFQPHTYTRTKAFLHDFAKALTLADKIVLTDIYAAREKNTIGISSKDLLHELEKLGKECYYFPSFDEIENFLLKNCINGDLLITMGAWYLIIHIIHILGHSKRQNNVWIFFAFIHILLLGSGRELPLFQCGYPQYPQYPHCPKVQYSQGFERGRGLAFLIECATIHLPSTCRRLPRRTDMKEFFTGQVRYYESCQYLSGCH